VGTNHISGTADRLRLSASQALSTYFAGERHKLLMVVGQLLITPTAEICIQQLC